MCVNAVGNTAEVALKEPQGPITKKEHCFQDTPPRTLIPAVKSKNLFFMSGPSELHSGKIRGCQWKTLPTNTSRVAKRLQYITYRVMYVITSQENKHMLQTKEKSGLRFIRLKEA